MRPAAGGLEEVLEYLLWWLLGVRTGSMHRVMVIQSSLKRRKQQWQINYSDSAPRQLAIYERLGRQMPTVTGTYEEISCILELTVQVGSSAR